MVPIRHEFYSSVSQFYASHGNLFLRIRVDITAGSKEKQLTLFVYQVTLVKLCLQHSILIYMLSNMVIHEMKHVKECGSLFHFITHVLFTIIFMSRQGYFYRFTLQIIDYTRKVVGLRQVIMAR
jgi:hypothetical protein